MTRGSIFSNQQSIVRNSSQSHGSFDRRLSVSAASSLEFDLIQHRPNISDAEWYVMQEVWLGEPITSGRIISRLSESMEWTPGTIKTLLHRLVQKGVLDFQRKGNRYLYRANISEAECIDYASGQLLHTVFKGHPVPMLAYLVQSARLSGTEVEALCGILDEIKRDLPPVAPRRNQA